MTETTVLHEVADHIATVTLNRPEKLNAYSAQMRIDLSAALRRAEADDAVRVVILTGAGRSFCAGLDLKEAGTTVTPPSPEEAAARPQFVLAVMEKPLIAAVNGHAIGVGFELVMHCDFRVMAEDATLNDMHAKRGLLPDAGGTWLLPRLIGWSRACEVLLLGEPIGAAEAERLGLVNRVVPPAELMPAARALAARLAANAPLSLRYTKRLMRQGLQTEVRPALEEAIRVLWDLRKTHDWQEGLAAYREKRPPAFQGR
jgi:enoyl-CoA hydratase/carnithine racemase